MTEKECLLLIQENSYLMEILTIIEGLDLADCWLCAGSIRNYLWDHLSGKKSFPPINDVDVIFYDPQISYEQTAVLEAKLKANYPLFDWELKNQAHMHRHNFSDEKPYRSTYDAVSKFPERCTAIGVRYKAQKLELLAPFGLQDIVEFRVRPTPHFLQNETYLALYRKRQKQKNWPVRWSRLSIAFYEQVDQEHNEKVRMKK